NLHEVEVLFPILAFFGERRRAVAHFDPLHAAIRQLARGVHVSQVLVASDRPLAERALGDRVRQRLFTTLFEPRGDEIAHHVPFYGTRLAASTRRVKISLEGTDVSRIEYRVALALILPVFVPCMLSAQPAAAKQHAAAMDTLSSIAFAAQQQPPATQPPQQTQPPATQP